MKKDSSRNLALETILADAFTGRAGPGPATSRRRLNRRAAGLLALEQRYVFDGAGAVDTAHAILDASARVAAVAAPAAVEVRPAEPARNEGRKEVVFVDTSIVNYQTLEAMVRSGVEVVEIDGSKSGLAQIARWAESHGGYDAIHILSHGSEGTLYLGSDEVSNSTLGSDTVQAELAALGHALKAGGDLQIYGCDLAAGSDGQLLLSGIADATGADVAASTGTTGNAARGGNWVLERSTGQIDTATIIAAGHENDYAGTLTLPATTTDFSGVPTSNPYYQGPITTAGTLTATDVQGTGWDVVADSPSAVNTGGSLTSFFIRGVNTISFGNGSVGVQAANLNYIDVRLNDPSYTFDLSSLSLRPTTTGTVVISALDANNNVIAGSSFTISGMTANVFNSINLSGQSGFNDVHGFRFTSFPTTGNLGTYALYIDNIAIADLKAAASANTAPANSAVPAVTGSATVGTALGATTGTWSDSDGDSLTYSYQWYRADDGSGTNASAIAGATAANYTLTTGDAHKYLKVAVTADDGNGHQPSANSAWKAIGDSAPVNATAPAISGSATVGGTLTATTGSWTDADGDTPTYSYQWYRADDNAGTNFSAIAGATGSTYTPTVTDLSRYVSVSVTANDGAGATPHADSAAMQVVSVPQVTSIVRAGGASATVAASAGAADYTVTFSESVTGVDAADFALTATGTASGTITGVTGSGTTYTVTVGSVAGDGTLRLDLNGSGTGIQNGSSVAIAAGYTAGQAYTLDHTAPAAPATPTLDPGSDSGTSTSDAVTNDTTPTFTGTAESGATVTVYDGTTALGTTVASGGNWSYTVPGGSSLSDGAHAITATATDAAGNVSAASSAHTVTIDTAAPGTIALDGTTFAATDATGGATVATLSASESATYALATGNGTNDADNGSFTIDGSALKIGATPLTAGTYKIYIQASDAAGNTGYQAFTLTVSDAPAVSGIVRTGGAGTTVATGSTSLQYTVTFDQSVTGVDAADFALTATGTASGAITGVTGSGTTYTVTVGSVAGDGTLRLDLNGSGTGIQNGSSVAIAAGYTAGQAYTLDHTAPAAPATPTLDPGSDSGTSTSDAVTNDTTPTFTGTAESGATVTVYDGTTALGTTVASGGNWSYTVPGGSSLSDGAHAITATATDAAGNVSAASSAHTVTIDTAAPGTIALDGTTFAATDATGGATVATLSASESATYALATGNGTNDADNGSFTIDGSALKIGATPLAAGTYKIYIQASDAAGNTGYQAFTLTVSDAPAVSGIVRTGGASATVAASASTIDYTVTFDQSVTGVDAADFALTATGTASGAITGVTGSGTTYTVTVGSVAGDGTLRLDLNGSGTGIQNGSSVAIAAGYTAGQAYTLDHTAPAAPATPTLDPGSDSGTSTSDAVTNDTTPTFTGTAESGATVTVYDGTTALGTTVASGGNWSYTVPGGSSLSDGAHAITATATDAAGNVSAASSAHTVTIDTAAPGTIALDGTTFAATDATGGATVATLSASESATYALATGNGTNDADNGSFTIDGSALKIGATPLAAGTYKIYIQASDAAGNTGYQAFTLTVSDAPAVSGIVRTGGASATVAASASTIDYTVTFDQSVTGVDAADFALTATGTASGTITGVTGSGTTYTVTVGSVAGDGTLRLDLNGSGTGIQNGSSVAIAAGYTAGQAYTLDHTVPDAPSTPDMDAFSDSGTSNSDDVTGNQRPTFTGTVGAGNTVTIYDGTSALGSATVSGGNWTFAPGTDLAEGSHAISAKATDAAGNVSSPSNALAVTIDTTAPTVTSLDAPAAGTYKVGDTLTFTVHTSEPVGITSGTPTLSLSLDGSARTAGYVSGAGTDTLRFSYTVQAGDLDGDGIGLGNIGGATMVDAAGNAFGGSLGGSSASGVKVDGVAPSVSSVSVPAAATYYAGQDLDFTVNFDEAVTVDTSGGTPRIAIALDTGGTVYANYVSGSGTSQLAFRHTVANGELDNSGITVGALGLNGGTIRDAAANDAGTTLNAVGSTALVDVDGSMPGVTGVSSSTADGAYKAGATITIEVSLDRAVTVDTAGGLPTLALSSGGTATYSAGSGTATLTFTYVVGGGENTSDLDTTSTAALSLNGATINDAGGVHVNADLTLPATGGSTLGSTRDIVIDTVAPTTTATSIAFSSDTGSSSTDLVTNVAAQTVSGTLSAAPAAGESVQVSFDDGATWNTATTTMDSATFTLDTLLTGADTLLVKVTDAAGNDGQGYSRSFALDTTAPTTAIHDIALSADTGASNSDFVTNTASQTITATLSAPLADGDIVYGSLDGGATWTDVTAKVAGTSLTWDGATLATGAIALKVGDKAGNVGTVAPQAYVLDTTAPSTSVASLSISSDTGISSTDFVTSSSAQTLGGTLSAAIGTGETVYVSLDNGASWSAASASGTTWTLAGQALAGSGTFKAKVTDSAGNDGAVYSQAYVLDTTAPAAAFTSASLSTDSGNSASDFVTDTAGQTITATLDRALSDGDIVYGSLDGGATWTDVTVKVAGTTLTWNGVTLSASGTLALRVADRAGNNGITFAQDYTVDTTAPDTTFGNIHISADTGASNSDFVTNTSSQTIAATLSAPLADGDIVYGSLDGGATWTDVTAKVAGTSLTWDGATLATGAIALKVGDEAGNVGTVATQAYVLDTTAPAVTGTSAAFSFDTGSSSTDLLTNRADQTISGTLSRDLAAGETVYVSLDAGATWHAATATTGRNDWALAGRTLTGAGTLRVKVTDSAGNDGAAYSREYALDTGAPSIVFGNMALSADTGPSSSDFITNTAGQTVGATLSAAPAADDRVFGSFDGGATWTDITAKVSGTTLAWNGVTLASSGTLMLKVTDAAGNDGATARHAYVVDTAAPSAPTVDRISAMTLTPVLSGGAALDDGSTLRVTVDDATYLVTPGGGRWTLDLATATPETGTLSLAPGQTYDVVATVTDAAGNTASDATHAELSIGTMPATVVERAHLSNDSGGDAGDFITNVGAQTIQGTLSTPLAAGEAIQISLDGGSTWTNATAHAGSDTWSAAVTLSGSGVFAARVVNTIGAGQAYTHAYVLDTEAPAAPTVDPVAGDTLAPVLSGSATLAAGDTLTVTVSGATYTVAAAAGRWTLDVGSAVPASGTLSLAPGQAYDVAATITDRAGNAGTSHGTLALNALPSTAVTSLALSADTGDSATDFITRTAQQTVSGGLSARLGTGEAVDVSVDGGTTWIRADAAPGAEMFSVGVTLSGTGNLMARVTNGVGSGNAFAHAYTIDTQAPTATATGLTVDGGDIRGTLSAPLPDGEFVLVSTAGDTNWQTAHMSTDRDSWSIASSARGTVRVKLSDTAGNDTPVQTFEIAPPPPVAVPSPAATAPVALTPEAPPVPALPAMPDIHFLPPDSPLAAPHVAAGSEHATQPTFAPVVPGTVAPSVIEPATPTLTAAPAAGGFRVIVLPAAPGALDTLVANQPLHDVRVDIGGRFSLQVSADAFAHSNAQATVSLSATRADGSALPAWLTFNPQTGQFSGVPPAGFRGTITVRVIARDGTGHEAVQAFRITVGKDGQPLSMLPEHTAPVGRLSLGQQLRGARDAGTDRLAALAHSARVAAGRA